MATKTTKKVEQQPAAKQGNSVQALGPRLVIGKLNDKSLTAKIQNVRLAFVRLDSPNTGLSNKDSNGEPIDGSYEATVLIPAGKFKPIFDILKVELEKLLKINKNLTAPADRLKALKNALTIGGDGALFKKGDDQTNKEGKVYDGLEGHYTFKVKSKAVRDANGNFKPKIEFKVVDKNNQNIPVHAIRDEVYSGVWADVVFTLSPYSYMGKTGITAYLGGVMKLIDDGKLGGSDPFSGGRDDIEDTPFSGFDYEELPL